nr:MAG TPA: PolyVal ADP-Ribosyltransferase [Caudoviricetes sp.]
MYTDSFKAWFGDWINDPKNSSKVIDENGEPLIVYHGTK